MTELTFLQYIMLLPNKTNKSYKGVKSSHEIITNIFMCIKHKEIIIFR